MLYCLYMFMKSNKYDALYSYTIITVLLPYLYIQFTTKNYTTVHVVTDHHLQINRRVVFILIFFIVRRFALSSNAFIRFIRGVVGGGSRSSTVLLLIRFLLLRAIILLVSLSLHSPLPSRLLLLLLLLQYVSP